MFNGGITKPTGLDVKNKRCFFVAVFADVWCPHYGSTYNSYCCRSKAHSMQHASKNGMMIETSAAHCQLANGKNNNNERTHAFAERTRALTNDITCWCMRGIDVLESPVFRLGPVFPFKAKWVVQ